MQFRRVKSLNALLHSSQDPLSSTSRDYLHAAAESIKYEGVKMRKAYDGWCSETQLICMIYDYRAIIWHQDFDIWSGYISGITLSSTIYQTHIIYIWKEFWRSFTLIPIVYIMRKRLREINIDKILSFWITEELELECRFFWHFLQYTDFFLPDNLSLQLPINRI